MANQIPVLEDRLDRLKAEETSILVDAETAGKLNAAQAGRLETLNMEITRAQTDLRHERERQDAERSAPAARRGDVGWIPADGIAPGGRLGSLPDGVVRALAPTDKLADLADPNDPTRDLNMVQYLRGIVTGDWGSMKGKVVGLSLTDAAGGYTVPEPLALRVIDRARNSARVMQAGALTIPMTSSTMRVARLLTDPTAAWKAENAPMSASDMTFDAVTLTAHTLTAMVKMSIELVEDSPTINETVEDALSQALALELDRAALRGSGTAPEPRGIRNTTGVNIQSQGANGAALTNYDPFSTAVQGIQEANGDPNAVIFAPRTAGALDRLKDTTGQPLQPPQSFTDLRKLVTSQIPTALTQGTASDASEAYVGQYGEMLIGVRTNLRIEASRQAADATESAFNRLQVWVRAYLRADVALAQPSHFTVITGIVP